MQPPVGIAPPPPDATTQARLNPPVGVEARVQPPVGGMWTDMIVSWLQSRISIPNG
jgi:hypothetical protein